MDDLIIAIENEDVDEEAVEQELEEDEVAQICKFVDESDKEKRASKKAAANGTGRAAKRPRVNKSIATTSSDISSEQPAGAEVMP